MRVIALDPGKLTGWAAAEVRDDGVWDIVDHGILPAKDIVMALATAQDHEYLGESELERKIGAFRPTFDVIVYEDWVLYRAHADEYIGSDMPYSQQIGQYRLIAWLSEVPIVKQPAARKNLARKQVHAWWPFIAAIIDSIEARQHKDGHDGDALLHLFAWTLDTHQNLPKEPDADR